MICPSAEDPASDGVQAGGNRINGRDETVLRPDDVGGPQVENRHVITQESKRVRITDGVSVRKKPETEFTDHQGNDFLPVRRVADQMRLPGDDPGPPPGSGNANEGNGISKKLVLEDQPIQIFQRQGGFQRGQA